MRVCVVIGTRPEAIKMAPVVRALRACEGMSAVVLATGQHREMLRQVFEVFGLREDESLDVMRPDQDLCGLNARLLDALGGCLKRLRPRAVLVQGDTTSAYAAAMAGFYHGIPTGHVEAGLRTDDARNPFPEEMNRRLVSRVAGWHFAPTRWAAENLLREGVPESDVIVTGNTVVDALKMAVRENYQFRSPELKSLDLDGKRVVLLTTHRRESFGAPMRRTMQAVAEMLRCHKNVIVVFPVHLNPRVQTAAREILAGVAGVHLIPPLDYLDFIHLMRRCHFVISDSGGVQEEAPSFGKPVLVLRENTERPEGVEAGTAVLVGTDRERILEECAVLLDDPEEYTRRARLSNPFGDGAAASRIVGFLKEKRCAGI